MKRMGFVVEGPSDKAFLAPVLYRHFPGCVFDIRVQHGRTKLIRNAPTMRRNLRATHSSTVFFLIDQDEAPCFSDLRHRFSEDLPESFAVAPEKRDTLLCVAQREIEAWFLADENAICEVTGIDYRAPSETGETATKRRLQDLLGSARNSLLRLNDIELAKRFGGKFDPSRARCHSASFDYFWSLVEAKVAAL